MKTVVLTILLIAAFYCAVYSVLAAVNTVPGMLLFIGGFLWLAWKER